VQNLARNNKLKKWFLSPSQDFQQLTLGQTLWPGCLTLIVDLSPRNVLAVVVDVNSSGLYLLGTKEGLLEQLYARSEFTTADYNFIVAHDVSSSSLFLRSASMITSGSKQRFVSCHCKRYCIDKKMQMSFEKYEM
jgi:hypothetical protein